MRLSRDLFWFAAWVALPHGVIAQGALPDPQFGNNGLAVVQNYGSYLDIIIKRMDEQVDGKIVMMGDHQIGSELTMFAQRFNANGTIDGGFANGGRFSGPDSLAMVGVSSGHALPDGRLLLVCQYRNTTVTQLVLVMLDQNGALDATYGSGGVRRETIAPNTSIYRSILAPDNSIYFTGMQDAWPVVGHVLPDGSFDPEFGTNGRTLLNNAPFSCYARDMVFSESGYLVIVCPRLAFISHGWCMAAVDLQGALVPWFGTNGFKTMDLIDNDLVDEYSQHIAMRPDGSLITSGLWVHDGAGHNMYWAFHPDGSINEGFGNNGVTEVEMDNAGVLGEVVSLLPDGDILFSGAQSSSNGLLCKTRVVRLNADGSFETDFGTNGIYYHYRPGAIFSQADRGGLLANGRLAVVGEISAPGPVTKNAIMVFNLQDISTGTSEALNGSAAPSVHPNPTNGTVHLRDWDLGPSDELILFDAQGRRQARWSGALVNGSALDLPGHLSSGAYTLVVNDPVDRKSARIQLER
ncbi:MAG: hypothetical protein IPI81_04875 [Flavobacteriales bacterium]|nr:hypothetical protein [Flavobacteriales bacterium]MCC6939287.1 hypothetical protein [Flavobacteriales bacterium]